MKNKHVFRLIALLLLSAILLIRPAAAKPLADSMLWQVSKPGQPTGYLIGTLHLGKKGSKLPRGFQAALNRSTVLVLESRVSPEYMQQHPQEVEQMFAHYLHGKTLGETVGRTRLLAAKRLYSDSPLAEVNRLLQPESQIAPWVVWFHFGYALVPADYDLKHGIDMLLERHAVQTGKTIISLERDEPLIMLKQLPDDLAVRGIDAALRHHQTIRRDTGKMFAAYRQGRLNQMWQWMRQPEKLAYGMSRADARTIARLYHDQLFKQRNLNWMPKITAMLPKHSHTIAVGAAHLPGEYGLINLLRKQGYRVEALPMH